MYIPQIQLNNLKDSITPGKVLVVYGPRRVGKTTLLKKLVEQIQGECLFVDADDILVRQYLESQSINQLRDFIGDHSCLIVDEAQNVNKIGLNLKMIVDHLPNVSVVASGSSSFELSKDVGEPLTGRKQVMTLFPLAQQEIAGIEKRHETDANLESRLIFGSYPEVVIMNDNRKRENYLREITQSYLFKDILALEGIRYSEKLVRLLQLLAFQIGREVSLSMLGTEVSMSKNTVERYLDLLEKAFVIFRRYGFKRNLRNEITKNHRYYFFDNGIRNALIGNFNLLSIRNDVGELWENYITVERFKKQTYANRAVNHYFWRTYNRKEIDLVEEYQGNLAGYEIKWKDSRVRVPKEWRDYYPDADFQVVHQKNYLEFIL